MKKSIIAFLLLTTISCMNACKSHSVHHAEHYDHAKKHEYKLTHKNGDVKDMIAKDVIVVAKQRYCDDDTCIYKMLLHAGYEKSHWYEVKKEMFNSHKKDDTLKHVILKHNVRKDRGAY